MSTWIFLLVLTALSLATLLFARRWALPAERPATAPPLPGPPEAGTGLGEPAARSGADELTQLQAEVARLGGLAEAQVSAAVDSVVRRDVAAAEAVIARDDRLDAMQRDIERRALRIIGLRQPEAQELRRAVAAMKLAQELERTGDLATNIAKRAVVLAAAEPMTTLTRSVERLGRLAAHRIKDVLDAYTGADVERALLVWSRDEEVDEHYNSLFRELLTYMMAEPRTITPCAHLLFIAKNLERIGDHATNVAEIIHYEITGDEMAHARPRADALSR